MALKVLDIQTLIAEGKIVDPGNIDSANAYLSVGLWQPGNRKSGGGNYSYPQFAIKLSDIGTGGQGNPGNQGPTGPIGPVGMTWRGGWSNAVNYAFRDVVYYNGSSYFCTVPIAASNNNPASTPTNWELVVLKGATGTTGVQGPAGPPGPVGPAGLNWQGLWSASGTYVADDAVGYNGASYFAINPVGPSPTPPDVDTANWALLAAQGAQGNPGVQGVPGNDGVGIQGPAGPVNTLTIGTVNSAPSPAASITGSAPNQVLNLTLPVGPAGPAGAVTSLTVENGLRNIGDLANPQLRLGGNPLIVQTEIASAGFNLSLSGTGKLGVGVDLSTGSSTAAKTLVRGNGGAKNITGTITLSAGQYILTVQSPYNAFQSAYTGTINVGDYIFIRNLQGGIGGIAYGTYIQSQLSPTTYLLNWTANAAAPSVPLTAAGTSSPAQIGDNFTYFDTVPKVLELQQLGGNTGSNRPALEVWENGMIRANNFLIDTITNRMALTSAGTAVTNNPFSQYGANGGLLAAPSLASLSYVSVGNISGGVNTGGNISFFGGSGFSSISGTTTVGGVALYDLNYTASRHRIINGTIAASRNAELGYLPSAYGGTDSSAAVNGGARQGYSLCVYQPYSPGTVGSTSGSVTGYISGNTLFVIGAPTGCSPLSPSLMTNGFSISGTTSAGVGIAVGTTITATVVTYVPGTTLPGPPVTCPGAATVGQYTISGAPQTVGSAGATFTINISAYPAWNYSRAMYIDGTIKFVNLPTSTTNLTAGDIWVDTSAGNVLKMV